MTAGLARIAGSIRSLGALGQHPRTQRRQPPANGPIQHCIANAHDDATENRRIHEEVRNHLLAVRARELLRDRATLRVAGIGGDGHVRVQPPLDLVNEIMKNHDSGFAASVWFYRDHGGKLAMGPAWDFDEGLAPPQLR